MKISNKGLNLIKDFEGCVLNAYKCPAGVWTIGVGHTGKVDGKKICSGMKISEEKAMELLKKDVEKFETHVMKFNTTYKWNQNQFDAMVSFAFNIGSITALTNNGKRTIAEISAKIPAYNKAGGQTLQGLVRRRAAEKELFDTPVANEKVSNKKVKYKVTASVLNCRKKANIESEVIGQFVKGRKLTLVKKTNKSWYKVKGKAMSGKTITGYCSTKYLEKVK